MRILLTGGTGYIGQALCPSLLDAGHDLYVYSRHPARVKSLCGEEVTGFSDLTLASEGRFDAVINLAGESIAGWPWTDARKRKLRDSRITLTSELCRHLDVAPEKPQIFISGSATGYYGDGGDDVLTEDSAPHEEFTHTLCADWEAAADHASVWGARVVKLRTGLVMGPNGGFLAPLKIPFSLGLGARLGSGEQWMSWISRNDIVRIIEFALTNDDIEGPINACAPNPVTNAEFTRQFAATLHRPVFFMPVPASVLRVGLGEMSTLLLTGQRAIPQRLEQYGFSFEDRNLEDALLKAAN